MSRDIIVQNLNISLSTLQDFMTFAKSTKFENLLDKNKTRKQDQKYYISKFNQTFDLKRLFKVKSKIREFLNIFETLQIFENFIQN